MAVIEIAKIQVRRGQENQTGIPQLDGGEFAWAADTEKLYIGLRREDGGSRDANVEILTENHWRNLFTASVGTATNQIRYTYRDETGITAIGSYNPASDNEMERTLQEKLDDTVSIRDFIGTATNTSLNWDLRLLQNAIDKLFLNIGEYDPHPAKKLHFPAGTYNLTSTLYIPAGTHIVGDGAGKTIFVLTENTSSMIKTCSGFETEGEDQFYKTFDTGDGSGGDFSTTSSARNIHIEDLTLTLDSESTTITEIISLLNLDCADKAVVRNVEFAGNFSTGTSEATGFPISGYIGLTMRGKGSDSLRSENILVDNCSFDGFYHAIKSNHDIKGTLIQNSEFTNLIRGITFNDEIDSVATYGPTNVRILNNKFDHIAEEGIYVGATPAGKSYVTSMNNYFEDVGNNFQGNLYTTGTSVITFVSDGNSSINDQFDRFRDQNALNNTPGSAITAFNPLVLGRTTIDDFSVSTATIVGGSGDVVFLRIPVTDYPQHLSIKYSAFGTQPSETIVTVSTSTPTIDAGDIIWISNTASIFEGSVVEGDGIEAGTTVVSVGPDSYIIVDPDHTGLTAGDSLSIRNLVDRMGNLSIYVQEGSDPDSIIVDDYNYITSDGQLVFGVTIDSTNRYYEVYGSIGLPISVTIEYQTKLMI
jgi:hypothetical protein